MHDDNDKKKSCFQNTYSTSVISNEYAVLPT